MPSAKNNVCKNLANAQRAPVIGISTEFKTCFFPVKNRVSHGEYKIECEVFLNVSKHHRKSCQNSMGFFVIAVIVKSVVGAMHSKEVSGNGVGRGA